MKLIVGLGNPGKEYEKTRHNVGFLVVDRIKEQGISGNQISPFRLENQFKAEITQTGGVGEDRVILAKPHTFMNLSGEAVKKIMDYYKIGTDDLWVVCDDLNLDLGTIRVRASGTDGGHNGLKSIISAVDHDFIRFRVGIGANVNIPSEAYVLQKFSDKDFKIIQKSIDKTAELVISSLSSGQVQENTFKI